MSKETLADAMMREIERMIDAEQRVPKEYGEAIDKLLPYQSTLAFNMKTHKYWVKNIRF